MEYFFGCCLGIWFMIIMNIITEPDNNIKETKQRPIIDYKLEGNNKQIDTIWIYNFKKH